MNGFGHAPHRTVRHFGHFTARHQFAGIASEQFLAGVAHDSAVGIIDIKNLTVVAQNPKAVERTFEQGLVLVLQAIALRNIRHHTHHAQRFAITARDGGKRSHHLNTPSVFTHPGGLQATYRLAIDAIAQ